VSSYVVAAAPDGTQCKWTAGPLTCEVSGLTNGTASTFSVTATSTIGTSPAFLPTASSVPAEPIVPAIPDRQPVVAPETPVPVAVFVPVREATEQASGVEDLRPVAPTRQTISLLPVGMLTERPSRGAQVAVTYDDYEPDEFVQLVVASTPRVLGTARPEAAGSVTMTLQIPAGLGPGAHTLAVYAPSSGLGTLRSAWRTTGDHVQWQFRPATSEPDQDGS
jgi:hypothetical protein